MFSGAMKTIMLGIVQKRFIWNIKNPFYRANSNEYFILIVRDYSQAITKGFSSKKMYNVIPQLRNTASEKDKNEFYCMFSNIVENLTKPYKNIPEIQNYYMKVLEGNLPNHRQAPGPTVVAAYRTFEFPRNLTPENIHLAIILGWCVDLVHCSWQINDDIMDGSVTRRGLPCWYKNDDVRLRAINDATFIQHSIYHLLSKYFSGHHLFIPAIHLFYITTLTVSVGQALDTMCLINGRPRLSVFTIDRYNSICRYKATYPQFILPIILAMEFAKQNHVNLQKQVKSILHEFGKYAQIQNDILNCYGDPLVTGKMSSDIRDGKCTWLIVKALEKVTSSQKKILEQHYGRSDLQSNLAIKSLYEDLGLLEDFLEYENENYNQLSKLIDQMPENFPQDFFLKCLNAIHGRDASIASQREAVTSVL